MDDMSFDIPTGRGNEPVKDACIPIFEMRPEHNPAASEQAGREIYDEVAFVTILVPGQRDQVVHRVRDEHRQRWPEQWAAFEEKREAVHTGTPLEQWPALGVGRVAELKASHIHTVEQLCEVADANLQRLGADGLELRKKARQFIEFAQSSASHEQTLAERDELREQLAERDGELAAARERIEELRELTETQARRMADLEANQRRKPGRQRREDADAAPPMTDARG